MLQCFLVILIFVTDPFNGWETLSRLKLSSQFDEILSEDVDVPVFSDELLAFEGKIVVVEGYVIPLQQSPDQDYFVLSRFPYSSCFFCGNAGPETVAEVYTKQKVPFKDEKVRVTGKLKLNSGDPLHLFYILEEAEVVKLD